jgi:hypothetical protein
VGQVIQIVGSLLVLAGFALAQRGVLDQKSRSYLLLNLSGSAVLAIDALIERQWGFLLLEGVWAIVSAISLVGVLLGETRARKQGSLDETRRQSGAGARGPERPQLPRDGSPLARRRR